MNARLHSSFRGIGRNSKKKVSMKLKARDRFKSKMPDSEEVSSSFSSEDSLGSESESEEGECSDSLGSEREEEDLMC